MILLMISYHCHMKCQLAFRTIPIVKYQEAPIRDLSGSRSALVPLLAPFLGAKDLVNGAV